MIKFKIKPKNQPFYFMCYIVNSRKELINLYYSLHPAKEKLTDQEEKQVNGLVSPFERLIDGKRQNHIGNVFLCKNWIGGGLIAHEALHCSIWHDRLINNNINAEYGSECNENEERLAYLLFEYTRKINDKLWKLGFIK